MIKKNGLVLKKNTARSGLPIITFASTFRVGEAEQQLLTLTVLDTKMSGTLEIVNN
jgi:hypothetical protein